MKANVGKVDRTVRAIAGFAALAAGFYFQSWWGAIGLIFLGTAAIGWCPPYALLGLNTCSTKE
jgi:hypothetical protein